ncbi:MAG: phosphoribosylamine--glycine ligase, partial [Fimbriimonadaceae bacterium]
MKVLVLGSGGREHALAWKLAAEAEVHAAPGNPGIAQVAECHAVALSDDLGIVELCRRVRPDYALVGPEAPLLAGLADWIREAGTPVVGPGAEAARLEGSKSFAKRLMAEAGVPTADFRTFENPHEAREYARQAYGAGKRLAIKARGPALGKGVVVADDVDTALAAIDDMLVARSFGDAGTTVVLEEKLTGPEFSLLTLCSDRGYLSLPVAQDYKRAYDADQGPNTGGMGSYSPLPRLRPEDIARTESEVVAPALRVLSERGIPYRGVLFSGLLEHEGRPHCLEYNVRFGDPETQSVVLRLGRGLAEALKAVALGEEIPPVEVRPNASVAVVLASRGYPGSIETGFPIEIGDVGPDVQIFHAGTKVVGGATVTAGGR